MSWVVLKYGGTSVATPERWAQIAHRVGSLAESHRVWVVASALAGISDALEGAIAEAIAGAPLQSFEEIRAQHRAFATSMGWQATEAEAVTDLMAQLERLLEGIRLSQEAPPRLRARILSFGELASTALGSAALATHGIDAVRVDARQLLRVDEYTASETAARYLEADVPPRSDRAGVETLVGSASVVVTQGFIASNTAGETCLLGRGGSDTSAALFGALLEAERVEIWTDVHGIFSTDPRVIPSARLIRRMSYREAQELAAMGAKVLHPRSLAPVAWANIPVVIRNTQDPDALGTQIGVLQEDDPCVMAVVQRKGVTLLSVETLKMWGEAGFLSRVFAPFQQLGVSVDLVATSQSAVSVTLDDLPGGTEGEVFQALVERLATLGTVQIVSPCSVVSIVGRKIRTALHSLGPAFAAFREQSVHMVSQSSEDLNLSFVVDARAGDKLVADLHARLLPKQGEEGMFGPSWEVLSGARNASSSSAMERPWWVERQAELLQQVDDGGARFVVDLAVVQRQARRLKTGLPALHERYYAMKANPHPEVLRTLAAEGMGIECVSAAEIERTRAVLGPDTPVLFTPNFCPVGEYAFAFEQGAEVTIDGPEVLRQAPDLFRGRSVALRIDPGGGLGHHEKVRTAGADQKFGHPIADVDEVVEAARALDVTVIGLHAHVGSGIRRAGAWARIGRDLATVVSRFPAVTWIDVGGGLGVVERAGQTALDLTAVNAGLAELAAGLGDIRLRMEPGRFLVSEAGVLLAPVTQVRTKGTVRFVGLSTGMNSLMRPALYGAWHAIYNLTRWGESMAGYHHVVGPICETGDVLGRDRLLPETHPGDVILIANSGAYGRSMSSEYNLRLPAEEVFFPV